MRTGPGTLRGAGDCSTPQHGNEALLSATGASKSTCLCFRTPKTYAHALTHMKPSLKTIFLIMASLGTWAAPGTEFKVAPSGHHLLLKDKPFFWLADTVWLLAHQTCHPQTGLLVLLCRWLSHLWQRQCLALQQLQRGIDSTLERGALLGRRPQSDHPAKVLRTGRLVAVHSGSATGRGLCRQRHRPELCDAHASKRRLHFLPHKHKPNHPLTRLLDPSQPNG